jgi:hypothetical protein
MLRQIKATISANFIFYRRNRILLIVGLFILAYCGFTLLPSFVYTSPNRKFVLLQYIFVRLEYYTVYFIGALGILTFYYYKSNRCLKMVFTKPCLPETWLLATFISTTLFSLLLYLIIFLFAFLIFPYLGFPFEWGLVYLSCYYFLISINIFAIFTFLSILIHPVVAGIIIFVSTSSYLYYFLFWSMLGLKISPNRTWLTVIERILFYAYLIVPRFDPYKENMKQVFDSFYVNPNDVTYLSYTFIYTLVLTSLFYFLSIYCLKKKRLI